MSLCGIPHLVFTRGRASIVLAFSSWTKAAQPVSFPYAFHIVVKLAVVVMDDLIIVSGAAIYSRPLPLTCVVLIDTSLLAPLPLTLMAV